MSKLDTTPRTFMPRIHQIDLCIQLMNNAFRDLSDRIPDEHPFMKDYQAMISGATRTQNAMLRIKKAMGVS